jgi:hypothetical protein
VDIFLRPEVSKAPNRGTQHAKAEVVEKIADLIFELGCELDDSTLFVKVLIRPVDAALPSKSKFESVQSTEEDKVDSAEEDKVATEEDKLVTGEELIHCTQEGHPAIEAAVGIILR